MEAFLPFTFAKDIFILFSNIYIDSVVPIRPAKGIQEFQAEYLRCLAEIPVIRLLPRQPRTMNSRLLPCSDTDRLTAFYIADRVRLRIFQCNQGDLQIHHRLFRYVFIPCHYIRQKPSIDIQLIPPLFKCNTVYLFSFYLRRNIRSVYLNHIIIALFLFL